MATHGNVFMHENMSTLEPPQCISKKHFGLITGIGLWWQYYMFCIKCRAYVSKGILTVSEEIRNRHISWWRYPADKVQVLHHGVDSKSFSPDLNVRMSMRQKLNLSEADKILIAIARLTPLKRIDRAIKAFNIVFGSHPNTHLVLAGSGPLEMNAANWQNLCHVLNTFIYWSR